MEQTKHFYLPVMIKRQMPLFKFSGCFFDFFPVNLRLLRNCQAEINIVKYLIQRCMGMDVKIKRYDHGRCKIGVSTSATLLMREFQG